MSSSAANAAVLKEKTLKKPPICMPDQVLCKKATVERMKAQQERWMAQREAALEQEEHIQPAGHSPAERGSAGQHAPAAAGVARPEGSGDTLTALEQARRLVADAVKQELQLLDDTRDTRGGGAREMGGDEERRSSDLSGTGAPVRAPVRHTEVRSTGSGGDSDIADEDFAELDEMQDFLTAVEFQMNELDDL